jgi:hypothetical protein
MARKKFRFYKRDTLAWEGPWWRRSAATGAKICDWKDALGGHLRRAAEDQLSSTVWEEIAEQFGGPLENQIREQLRNPLLFELAPNRSDTICALSRGQVWSLALTRLFKRGWGS